MSLIKKPVFKSIRAAMAAMGSLAIAPYANNIGEERDSVRLEYVNRIEEFKVVEGNWESPFICLWGESDFFMLYEEEYDNTTNVAKYAIVDGVYNDDNTVQKYHDDLLELIKRCILVGYIPIVLMQAMRDYGRYEPEIMHQDFMNIFGEVVEHVEDILEMFEQ